MYLEELPSLEVLGNLNIVAKSDRRIVNERAMHDHALNLILLPQCAMNLRKSFTKYLLVF